MIEVDRLYQAIGATIRKHREEKAMTQAALGEKLGLQRTSITNIEKGLQKTPLHVVYEICAFFDLRLEDMLPPVDQIALQKRTLSTFANSESVRVGEKTASVDPKTAAVIKKLNAMPELSRKTTDFLADKANFEENP